MSINSRSILSPTNRYYNRIMLYNKHFKNILQYLYYFIYTKNDKEKEQVMNATTIEELLSLNFQLHDIQLPKNEVNKYVYTLITYLYCTYDQYRDAIHNLTPEDNMSYSIINDKYIGYPFNKYAKAVITFKNNLVEEKNNNTDA